METLRIKRALLSVSNKEGILGLGRLLHGSGVEILATGGTAKTLQESGIPITPMEKITGNPEAFGGRMKSISFPLASALLYRRGNTSDEETAQKMGIAPVDLVVCNLYPFQEARKKGVSDPELIEEIDVGGPTMIRAAAKNHDAVAVLTHPSQYHSFLEEFQEGGVISLETRKHLAVRAFRLLASYDSAIAEELSLRYLGEETRLLRLEGGKKLRYGENPHQEAILFRDHSCEGVSIASADVLQGKALSYNNILDGDAALRSASDIFHLFSGKKAVVSIIKHLNPCGLAAAQNSLEALELAWAGDPISAFGGILCFSHPVTLECAEWLGDKFVELIVAPQIEPDAAAYFAKKKNLRLLLCAPRPLATGEKMIRSVYGGVLVQTEDEGLDPELQTVTKNNFPEEKKPLAHFGVLVAKHLRSNAIALVGIDEKGNCQLLGAGMGQPNRIDCIRILAGPRAKAKGSLASLVMVSDAFFPFPDAVEAAHELGIFSIVQPGGSMRDEEVIQAADRLGIAMAFTGRRHFRH